MEEEPLHSTIQSLKPHFNALARVGYYKVIPQLVGTKLFMHNVYRNIMWILIITYNIQHIIRVIQVNVLVLILILKLRGSSIKLQDTFS